MKVIGYVRVSSEEQTTGYSIEAQTDAIERWADQAGHQLARIYVEPGLSGKTDKRPEFQRAISAVLGGEAEALVVHKFDRFARNVLDSRLYKQMLRANGQDIVSVTEPIEDSPAGLLMEGVLELFAEYYVVNLGAEVRKGQRAKAQQGGWPGRTPPTGYERQRQGPASWIEVSNQGQMITDAFNEFASGAYTLASWADEAYRRGYRGQRSEQKIYKSTWAKIFRNRFYLGRVVWNGEEFMGQHEPLIDEQTFETVQAILDDRGPGRQQKRHRYLLRGLLFSTVHQAVMTGNTVKNKQGRRFHYYRALCKGKTEHNIRCQEIERQVASLLYHVQVTDTSVCPESFRLALTIAPNVGALFEALSTFDDRRQLLECIFAPGSIRVGPDGLEDAAVSRGFELFKLDNSDSIVYAVILIDDANESERIAA